MHRLLSSIDRFLLDDAVLCCLFAHFGSRFNYVIIVQLFVVTATPPFTHLARSWTHATYPWILQYLVLLRLQLVLPSFILSSFSRSARVWALTWRWRRGVHPRRRSSPPSPPGFFSPVARARLSDRSWLWSSASAESEPRRCRGGKCSSFPWIVPWIAPWIVLWVVLLLLVLLLRPRLLSVPLLSAHCSPRAVERVGLVVDVVAPLMPILGTVLRIVRRIVGRITRRIILRVQWLRWSR